ncbi:hypothetical protein JaAD80_18485 [Janthinobacterium sp. AD80]|nr:hypothetical protein JaAD80_18485 [Janthinobacterium sp. AD80]
MQCHLARRVQAGHGGARQRQRRFGLPQRRLVQQPLAMQQRGDLQQRRVGVDLAARQIEPRLQALDGQVQVGRLRRHGQARGGPCRVARFIIGTRRFALAPQAAEQVEFPRCLQVQFARAAGALVAWRGIQDLAQRRLHRLVGARRLAVHAGRRQQRGVGRTGGRARLRDPGLCLRQVEVLRQRHRHQTGQARVAKAGPPLPQFGGVAGLARAKRRLVPVLRRLRQFGPAVVGTGGAASGSQAGGDQNEGEARAGQWHDGFPVQKRIKCDYNTFWSLIVHSGAAR